MNIPTAVIETADFKATFIGANMSGGGRGIVCKTKTPLRLHIVAVNTIKSYVITISQFVTRYQADKNGDLLVDLSDFAKAIIPNVGFFLKIVPDVGEEYKGSIYVELGEFDTLNLSNKEPHFPNRLIGIEWGAIMIGKAIDIEGAQETEVGSGEWIVSPFGGPLKVQEGQIPAYPIKAEDNQCGEKTAFLKWRDRFTGKFKQHSWRIVSSTLESGKVVMLDDVLSPFVSLKGVSESITLEIDGLTREGIRYYSDIILSDDVYCITDFGQEFTELDRVLVTNKNIKLPEQGYEFGSVEITIKAVENDAL